MLAEFGAIGALISGYLIFRQLGMVFGWGDTIVYGLTAAATVGYRSCTANHLVAHYLFSFA